MTPTLVLLLVMMSNGNPSSDSIYIIKLDLTCLHTLIIVVNILYSVVCFKSC